MARCALIGPKVQYPQGFSAGDLDGVELEVTVKEVKPTVWRKLAVPSSLTLHELSDVIQIATGWQDCHLHQFTIDDKSCSCGLDWGEVADVNDGDLMLADALSKTDAFRYEYDFWDGWDHEIRVVSKVSIPAPGRPGRVPRRSRRPPT